MIAIQKSIIRVLAFGLNGAESHSINEIVMDNGGEIHSVDTDLDLWEAARAEPFDVCILGQSEALPYPTLRIWLLRGLLPHARIIVLYDEIGSLETGPLEDCQQVEMIQRPANPFLWQDLLEPDTTIPQLVDSPVPRFSVERPVTEDIQT